MKIRSLAIMLLVLFTTAVYGQAVSADAPATPTMQSPSVAPGDSVDNLKPPARDLPAKTASTAPWHKHSLDKDLRNCLKYDTNAEIRACVAKNE
jgi:hypothetical protein